MAFQIKKKKPTISDINVTPLVDVMLVLLVIFMITAPLMLNAIKLELPKTKEVNRINPDTRQVILSLTREGNYFIGKKRYLIDELVPELQAELTNNKSQIVYVRADYGIIYGKVAQLMSYLKQNGISQIALVTETEK